MSLGAEGVLHLAVQMSANSHVSRVHAAQPWTSFLFSFFQLLSAMSCLYGICRPRVRGSDLDARKYILRRLTYIHTCTRRGKRASCPRANTPYTKIECLLPLTCAKQPPLAPSPARPSRIPQTQTRARRSIPPASSPPGTARAATPGAG